MTGVQLIGLEAPCLGIRSYTKCSFAGLAVGRRSIQQRRVGIPTFMNMPLTTAKAYSLALLAVIAGTFASFSTDNWSWFSRSGSAIVIIGILLTSSQILEHIRRLKQRRASSARLMRGLTKPRPSTPYQFNRDFASEDRLRSIARAQTEEEDTWEVEGHGLYILISGTLIWGFGDLVGLVPFLSSAS